MIVKRLVFAAIAGCWLFTCGCGETKSVTVGDGQSKGAYKRTIDSAGDVAGKASDSVKSGDKDLTGD